MLVAPLRTKGATQDHKKLGYTRHSKFAICICIFLSRLKNRILQEVPRALTRYPTIGFQNLPDFGPLGDNNVDMVDGRPA